MSSSNHRPESQPTHKTPEGGLDASIQALDTLTLGAFFASTSAERVLRLQQWLASSPATEQVQVVYRELSHKDKGAAKLLRERLDEIKRSRNQADMAQDWANKAQVLLDQPRMNLADAMAWQRDAAKAGAPLSKEPLLALKTKLAERVLATEDLQHRVQVQRESALLLAQRIEVLSTKSWAEAQACQNGLQADVARWQAEAQRLHTEPCWESLDPRFSAMLDDAQSQLLQVWEAFQSALQQAVAASEDPNAALPQVPVWAEALRSSRREADPPTQSVTVDPEQKAQAEKLVNEALAKLESEVSQGHGKASAGAASALRSALSVHGRLIDQRLDKRAHRVLSAAGELESWQRWRADQLREELVAKALALTEAPAGQAIGGRKVQEQLRALREQWKLTDQGGVPNHGLWKKFDSACNQAHKLVEAWLRQRKEEATAVLAQRQALIDELKQWAEQNRIARDDDWRGFSRVLQDFAERWRQGGHLDKKHFERMQSQWKQAMEEAQSPLKTLQQASVDRRQALIEEAKRLMHDAMFQIQAVKALQQRWQAEAHGVPLDRRLEQKLWDAFRKPIDQAFERRQAERSMVDEAAQARDRQVVEASKALQQANASGDAQQIRRAMDALQNALQGPEARAGGVPSIRSEPASTKASEVPPQEALADSPDVDASPEAALSGALGNESVRRPVVAMRGDDRPGNRLGSVTPARAEKAREPKSHVDRDRGGPRAAGGQRPPRTQTPRLGEAAFRAQRDAMEHAQSALRKLAAHAHGEALTQLLEAWERRDASVVPAAQALSARLNAPDRSRWMQAIEAAAKAGDGEALLRLEMAAEVPSPADFLSERRMLQLQLLTRRHDPLPAQTWVADVARVLAQPSDPVGARRLQNALKVLLRA